MKPDKICRINGRLIELRKSEHTPECWKRLIEWVDKRVAWEKKYPFRCWACDGVGYHEYSYDPSAGSVSLAPGSMTEVEVCDQCEGAEESKCSLCAKPIVWPTDDVDMECPCKKDELPRPDDFECECWSLDRNQR